MALKAKTYEEFKSVLASRTVHEFKPKGLTPSLRHIQHGSSLCLCRMLLLGDFQRSLDRPGLTTRTWLTRNTSMSTRS